MDIVKSAYVEYVRNEPFRKAEVEARGKYSGKDVKVELKYDKYALFFKWRVICTVYGNRIGDTQISVISFRKYNKAHKYFMNIVKKYNLKILGRGDIYA